MFLSTLALASVLAASPAATPSVEIEWMTGNLSRALSRARTSRSPVFVYIWTGSSQQCQNTWNDAIATEAGQSALLDFVCFSAPIGEEQTTELIRQFNVTSLPTMLVLTPYGEAEDALLGYHSESFLVSELGRVLAGIDTVSARRDAAEAAPDDLDLRFGLATKLDHVGLEDEAKELYDSIRRDDPQGKTAVAARLHLWDVMRAVADEASDPGDMATFDPEPMYAHMPRVIPDAVALEGWEWLSQVEQARGDRERALAAMQRAWNHVRGEAEVLGFGLRVAWFHWTNRDVLDPQGKAFALEVALACEEVDRLLEKRRRETGEEAEERDYDALDVLAVCYLLNGRAEEALATAERSLARSGSTPQREQLLELCRGGKP